MIEKDKYVYVSGYLKPIYEDNPSAEGGIAVKMLGPLGSWWVTGFDETHRPLIGLSSGKNVFLVDLSVPRIVCVLYV